MLNEVWPTVVNGGPVIPRPEAQFINYKETVISNGV